MLTKLVPLDNAADPSEGAAIVRSVHGLLIVSLLGQIRDELQAMRAQLNSITELET